MGRRHGVDGSGCARRVMLAAPTPFGLPRFGAPQGVVGGTPSTVQHDAIYYDSADLALAACGITVTRSSRGRWTLALPPHEQAEAGQELTFDAAGTTVPIGIRDRLHTQLRSRRLLPVARLQTTRTSVEVLSSSGSKIALVTHDDVLAYRGAQPIHRFGAVEVHAAGHDDALLQSLVDTLVASGCVPAPPAHAVQRAFGVLSGAGPAADPPTPRRPRSAPLRDFVAPMLGMSVQRLMAHDVGVRRGEDIEDVHQLRVATRRLRADLRALKSALDRTRTAQLRAELGWLGSLAGPVRDADVLLARLRAAVATLDGTDAGGPRLVARLVSERARAREALIAGMRSPRYDALLDALVGAVADPPLDATACAAHPTRPGSAVLARATLAQWRELARAVAELPAAPSIDELHQVRIAAKRARYTAEAAEGAVGKRAARLASLATRIQTTLGDLHDSVIAAQWLQTAAAREPATAATAGRLRAAELATGDQLQGSWQSLWTKVAPKADRALAALAKAKGKSKSKRRRTALTVRSAR